MDSSSSSPPPPSKRRRKDQQRIDATSSPVVVFAHGAGAPSSSDWMIKWRDMLKKALNAVEVVTFDYPYISGGKRKAPPKAEKLVDFHADVVKRTVARFPGHPLILAGKSMGSRVSCMVAGKEDIAASSVICLGYPLKGMNGAVRDETLLQLTVPVMFVQGSKDWLCPLEKLETVRKKMKPMNDLHVIDGGDHSFKIAKKHLQIKGTTQEEDEDLAVQAIAAFVSASLGERAGMADCKEDILASVGICWGNPLQIGRKVHHMRREGIAKLKHNGALILVSSNQAHRKAGVRVIPTALRTLQPTLLLAAHQIV